MKLTKKKAIEYSIELWTWLVKAGAEFKGDWDGWDKYGKMSSGCPLCEYAGFPPSSNCRKCPYYKKFKRCYDNGEDTIYSKWEDASTPGTRKKYAKLFLEHLKEL